MKNIKKVRWFAISMFFITHIIGAEFLEKKQWTVLMYMTVPSSMAEEVRSDLQAMMSVGSNDQVNILVYLIMQEDGHYKEAKKLYIEKGNIIHVGSSMMRDGSDVTTLTEALHWSSIDYPSEHSAVIVSGYGFGECSKSFDNGGFFKGVCYDVETGHYLTDKDLFHAFSWVRDNVRQGIPLDIIAFDVSFFASIEIAYMLSSCAHYFIAPQASVSGHGYGYASLLQPLTTHSLDSLSFARWIASSYKQSCGEEAECNLSVLRLDLVNSLVDNINAVSQILSLHLEGKNHDAVKLLLKKCINQNACISFDRGKYIDLCQFYKNLIKHSHNFCASPVLCEQFQHLVKSGIHLLVSMIKTQVKSSHYNQAHGLSIYFSRFSIDQSYYGCHWAKMNPNWLSFLESYVF